MLSILDEVGLHSKGCNYLLNDSLCTQGMYLFWLKHKEYKCLHQYKYKLKDLANFSKFQWDHWNVPTNSLLSTGYSHQASHAPSQAFYYIFVRYKDLLINLT